MKIVINITGGTFEPPQDLLQKLTEEYVFRLIPCDTFNRCARRAGIIYKNADGVLREWFLHMHEYRTDTGLIKTLESLECTPGRKGIVVVEIPDGARWRIGKSHGIEYLICGDQDPEKSNVAKDQLFFNKCQEARTAFGSMRGDMNEKDGVRFQLWLDKYSYLFSEADLEVIKGCVETYTTRVLDEASKVIQRVRDNSGGSLQNQRLIK